MDYERYESNLRERLIQLRMEAKLSQSELAEKLGVSRPTLDKLLDDFTKKKGE